MKEVDFVSVEVELVVVAVSLHFFVAVVLVTGDAVVVHCGFDKGQCLDCQTLETPSGHFHVQEPA